MNQQLIDYIKNQIKLGRSEDVIKVMLKNNGWQDSDIEEGFREISGGANSSASTLPQSAPSGFQPVFPSSIGQTELALPGAGALLKNSWQIYKSRFWTLIGITIIPNLILFLGAGFILLSGIKSEEEISGLLLIVITIIGIIGFILFIWAGVALFYAVANETFTFKEAFRQAGQKGIKSFFWVGALITLIILGGFVLGIVPAIIFWIWFIAAPFVFVVEGQKGFNALLRSKEYVTGRWGKVFWRMLVFGLVALGVGLIDGGISLVIDSERVSNIISSLINVLSGSFAATYFFSLYSSLRQTRPQLVNQPVVAKKGFFVFCAILGVLAPFIILVAMMMLLVLNPNKILKEARDAQRIGDVQSLNMAISLYKAVVSEGINCQNDKTYSSNIGNRAVDGTGWLPIDFTKIPGGGSPLVQLNIDPLNNSEFFYSYTCDSKTNTFELNTRLESEKYLDMMKNDGGDDLNLYETGSNLNLIR